MKSHYKLSIVPISNEESGSGWYQTVFADQAGNDNNKLMSDDLLKDIEKMTQKKLNRPHPYGSDIGTKILQVLDNT